MQCHDPRDNNLDPRGHEPTRKFDPRTHVKKNRTHEPTSQFDPRGNLTHEPMNPQAKIPTNPQARIPTNPRHSRDLALSQKHYGFVCLQRYDAQIAYEDQKICIADSSNDSAFQKH